MLRRYVAIVVCGVVVGLPAHAQDDDLLAPVPVKKKPAAKPPVRPVKKPPADDLLAPIPSRARPEPAVTRPKSTEPGILTIRLGATTPDAEVTLDGKDISATATKGVAVEPGEHQIVVRRLGFSNLTKKITVQAGRPLEVNALLTPVAAVISLTSDVPEAQVFLNGRSVGTAPIAGIEVPPGQVEIAVRKDGYRDDARVLSVIAGREYPVSVRMVAGGVATLTASDRPVETSLTPTIDERQSAVTSPVIDNKPITTKPAFWIVVTGVVIAAAAATAGVLVGNAVRSGVVSNTTTAAGEGLCNVVTPGVTCGPPLSLVR
jgi:hypothetical protein